VAAVGYEKADFWAQKAKKDGYPARSVYKLMELDKKFKLIKANARILDIGAAPGSWSLWVLERLDGKGFLSAVDLQPLRIDSARDNLFFVQGDLYDPAVKAAIAAHGPYDLVMSDAAPGTSGNKGLDTDRSEAIVEAVLDYASEFLRPGGHVVAKLFIGGGQREILDRIKKEYDTARAFKPESCRSESFETYVLGLTKKRS
jgi:23S rRNA (uridine2552-2'-O)-methyltransferase